MTPSAIEAVSFDAYGTLFAGGSDDFIAMLAEVLDEHAPQVTIDAALGRREELIAELQQREFVTMRARDDWILGTLFHEYGIGLDHAPYVEALNRTYYNVKPYPDALPCVQALADRGVPMAVASNADVAMMREVLQNVGLADAFPVVVTSESARAYKPAPPMFRAVAEGLGAPAERILHVGDSYTADVEGAKRAGMHAAWLQRPGGLPAPEKPEHRPDHILRDLREVLDLLR